MQYATYNEDQSVWEAARFSLLAPGQLEHMRGNLSCVECRQFAWYRKESAHGHPAHFCAHHLDTCALRVEYVVSGERDGQGHEVDQLATGENIVVRLDLEEGTPVAINAVQNPPYRDAIGGGTRYIGRGDNRETNQHFTLRRILYRLVQSPAFRESNSIITLYRNEGEVLLQGPINRVAVSFGEISQAHHGHSFLYWGPIAYAGRTPDGKIWLNSSTDNRSVSVAVFEDIADEFLRNFDIRDIEELAGAHILVVGTCQIANSGKPVIWCGSPKFVVVRKYRNAN